MDHAEQLLCWLCRRMVTANDQGNSAKSFEGRRFGFLWCEMGVGECLLTDHCLADTGTQMPPLPCSSCPFLCTESNAVSPAEYQRDTGSSE